MVLFCFFSSCAKAEEKKIQFESIWGVAVSLARVNKMMKEGGLLLAKLTLTIKDELTKEKCMDVCSLNCM